ncbi:MAG: hypothetical protein Q4D57_02400 [Clostridia bacterium]|nr:hypothetical protein [Clostridia bacterium]
MNILKKCMGIWDKFKKIGGKYLKTLLIFLGVAGALFAGHKLDANAGDNPPPEPEEKGIYVKLSGIKDGNLINMPSREEGYNPFYVELENDPGEFKTYGPFDDDSVNGTTTHCFVGLIDDQAAYEYGSRFIVKLSEGYDCLPSDQLPFSQDIQASQQKAVLNLMVIGAVGKRPRVIIKDKNDNDVSDEFNITSDFTLTKQDVDSYKYTCNSINIKAKEGSTSKPSWMLDRDVLTLESGATSYTRNTDGDVILTGYTGNTDVVFKLNTKRMYIGSKNDADPWKNEDLAKYYDVTAVATVPEGFANYILSPSDNYDLGAWQIEYKLNVTSFIMATFAFRMEAKNWYQFSNNVGVELEPNGSGRTSQMIKDGAKKVNIYVIFNSPVAMVDGLCVKVSGQEYEQFTNTFQYGDGTRKLNTFITRPQYKSSYITWVDISGWEDASNVGKDVWTIADPYRVSGESSKAFSSTYRFCDKPGYYLGDAGVSFDGQGQSTTYIQQPYPDDFYGEMSFEVSNEAIANHTIVINGVKKHYDVTFKPQDDFAKADMTVEGSALSDTGVNVTGNASLDEPFKATLKVVNDRKVFKSAEDIKRVWQIEDCEKISDTEIKVTIPHKTASTVEGVKQTIKIPDDILDWKTASANFAIDISDVDAMYKDEAIESMELHKSDVQGTEGELIALKKGNESTLVNVNAQTDVPYNELIYTLVLKDSAYLDLSNAKVEIEGGMKDEATKISGPSGKTKFVFRLDPNLAGASYKNSLRFRITGIETSLIPVQFTLCPKANLYLQKSDGSSINIANAPSDSPTAVDVGVPEGGAKYLVMYTDYSKEFKEENIQGNNVEINNKKTESFNRLSFEVVPGGSEPRTLILKDPAKTAPPVKFTPVEGVNYYNVKNGAIDETSPIQGTINIPYGEEFSFGVKCNEGYDPETLEMKANDNVFGKAEGFTKNGDIFTMSGSKTIYPITITGSVHATQKKVHFETNLNNGLGKCGYIYNGASVSGDVTVIYGQGIALEVTLPSNCNQSDVKVNFYPDGGGEKRELSKVNGKYILNNITTDGTIKTEGASINKYPVTFISNSRAQYKTKDGKNLSGTQEVEHAKSFEFRVDPNPGYTMGKDSVVYVKYADGRTTTLKPNNDVYKINNIQQACTVSIENVEDIVYTVTLVPADGVTYRNDVDNVIKDSVKIKHGRNFEFSVLLSDEYDDSLGGMNIIVNDGKSSQSSAQKLASGRYVIPNVSEDITIKVGNVRKNTYTVSLIGAEGIDYYDSSGKIITGDNQAEHHSDFSFKVELYPAYAGSDITVMLGDTPMSADSNGFYTIPKISESKTVTVVGIEPSDSSELVNRINNLPDSLGDLSDVDDVIEATKAYEALSDAEKALIGNADKLRALQEKVKDFHHVSNDVRISGVDWYIKLYAIPITDDTDACGRIYKKLGSEYILSLYNVYLWNTLTDTRYTLPEGQSAVVTLPTPDMKYFEKPTAIHEKDTGKLEFINASINSDITTFQTDSFSPMGIVANRSSTPGRSSLLDAADANLDAISNFAASVFGNDTNKVTRSGSDRDNYNDLGGDSGNDEMSGNIDEKFRSRNNKTTAVSSALRLALVLMILILIGLMIYFFIKNRKDKKKSGEE